MTRLVFPNSAFRGCTSQIANTCDEARPRGFDGSGLPRCPDRNLELLEVPVQLQLGSAVLFVARPAFVPLQSQGAATCRQRQLASRPPPKASPARLLFWPQVRLRACFPPQLVEPAFLGT